jgi:phenylalanyl-tRNA synthetase beta chain
VPWLHPGVAAQVVTTDGVRVGLLGEMHPLVRRAYDIAPTCFGFELELERLPVGGAVAMRTLPRYPAITRDVSFFVDANAPAARIRAAFAAGAPPLVEHVTVLEDYRDPKHVPAGKKGMLWSVTYRADDRTLTDAEVDTVHEAIVAGILTELGAERR